MKSGMLHLLIFFLLLMSSAVAWALPHAMMTSDEAADSLCRKPLSLYFRLGRSLLEYDYMDNASTLSVFSTLFSDSLSASRIDTVLITAYASPDGDEMYNRHLAGQRAVAVKGYMVWKYPCLEQKRIITRPQGEDWAGLRRMIAEDNGVPDREEVLQILDEVSDQKRCKQLLMRLNRGAAYRYIYKNILPRLRNATFCMIRMKGIERTVCSVASNEEMRTFTSPVIKEGETSDMTEEIKEQLAQHAATCLAEGGDNSSAFRFKPLLALKTNLLFDLALAPNVELELPLGRNNRWSLNAEWVFPWWLMDNDNYCFQILSGGLEGRYWLGNRAKHRSLCGHFIGFYAGAGKYDLQWKENGYQGEFYIASGISYGYAMPVLRRLHLEFSLGIGLLRTGYEHYHAINDNKTLLWQDRGNYTWLGPTKVKISLVWLLGGKLRKGEER